MNYQRELDAALEAARQAGKAILDQYARFQAIANAPADITTAADHQAQGIILAHLHGVFPTDALCAEESTGRPEGAPSEGSRLWVVDPIDGTRGFARKNGEFSVMIGFVVNGRPTVGVVYEPALRRLTYAARDSGCWRRDGEGTEPVACQVSDQTELSKAALTQSRSKQGAPPSPYVQALRPARLVETYSAGIKMALVARAEADLYVNDYPKFHDWDICAGHVLVEEAGGRVTGLQGGELQYGLPGAPQQLGLLASNHRLYPAALAAIRDIPLAS